MEHSITDYKDDIKRVSQEVARQFAGLSGEYGHGYEIVCADDIEQAVWEQFLKSGLTAAELDEMDSAQAYIRTTARFYGANNEARARRRTAPLEADPNSRVETLAKSDSDGTEDAGGLWCLLSAAETSVVNILFSIEIEAQQRIAWLCYFKGMNSLEMAEIIESTPAAVRKTLQRARRDLEPEQDAALRAWREFVFPHARKLRSVTARPEVLLKVVSDA